MKAIYPGSFDPLTHAHEDIIEQASKMFDSLVVGILINNAKTPLFSMDERIGIISDFVKKFDNVEVKTFNGLLIDFAHQENGNVLVRGLRAVSDFEYELQMSQTNKALAPDITTIFLTTDLKYSYLSSSMVKEIASYHGDISGFVNKNVENLLKQKFKEEKR